MNEWLEFSAAIVAILAWPVMIGVVMWWMSRPFQ